MDKLKNGKTRYLIPQMRGSGRSHKLGFEHLLVSVVGAGDGGMEEEWLQGKGRGSLGRSSTSSELGQFRIPHSLPRQGLSNPRSRMKRVEIGQQLCEFFSLTDYCKLIS